MDKLFKTGCQRAIFFEFDKGTFTIVVGVIPGVIGTEYILLVLVGVHIVVVKNWKWMKKGGASSFVLLLDGSLT